MSRLYIRVWDKRYGKYLGQREINNMLFSALNDNSYKIEQWTGLVDKNYNDIYVGDILKREDGRIGSVVFEDGELILYEDGTSLHWLIERVKNNIEEVFIIGNINENKELLE